MTTSQQTTSPAILAIGLSKWYGNVAGLLDVDLTVTAGVVGLLGPNGAGKTTFLRLVTGQLRPSTGSLTLFGKDPWSHPSVLTRLGYCPEHDGLWEELSGRAFVRFAAELAGMSRGQAGRAADEAIEAVTMAQAATTMPKRGRPQSRTPKPHRVPKMGLVSAQRNFCLE